MLRSRHIFVECLANKTVVLNLEPSEGASLFHEVHRGSASSIVPAFVDRILSDAT